MSLISASFSFALCAFRSGYLSHLSSCEPQVSALLVAGFFILDAETYFPQSLAVFLFPLQSNVMAIATGIPGFEVTIEVDTVALPEYQHGVIEDDEVSTSASRYIEAPPATGFAIRYLFRPPFTPPSAIQMDVLLDGDYVQAPFVEWGGKENCEGYLCSRSTSSAGGHSFTQGFRFAELRTGKLSCLAKC